MPLICNGGTLDGGSCAVIADNTVDCPDDPNPSDPVLPSELGKCRSTSNCQLESVPQAVAPTGVIGSDVTVNFSESFLLELFLTTAMQPLDISGLNCTFDNPPGVCSDSSGGLADLEVCTVGSTTDLCAILNGTCRTTDGADITLQVALP